MATRRVSQSAASSAALAGGGRGPCSPAGWGGSWRCAPRRRLDPFVGSCGRPRTFVDRNAGGHFVDIDNNLDNDLDNNVLNNNVDNNLLNDNNNDHDFDTTENGASPGQCGLGRDNSSADNDGAPAFKASNDDRVANHARSHAGAIDTLGDYIAGPANRAGNDLAATGADNIPDNNSDNNSDNNPATGNHHDNNRCTDNTSADGHHHHSLQSAGRRLQPDQHNDNQHHNDRANRMWRRLCRATGDRRTPHDNTAGNQIRLFRLRPARRVPPREAPRQYAPWESRPDDGHGTNAEQWGVTMERTSHRDRRGRRPARPSTVRAWRRTAIAAVAVLGLCAGSFGAGESASAVLIPIPPIPIITGITIPPTLIFLPVATRDIVVTVADALAAVKPGDNVVYTITVTNNWSAAVTGVPVLLNLPTSLSSAIWSCGGSPGAECAPGQTTKTGSGSINTIVSLPALSGVAFTLSAQVAATATGTVDVTVTAPAPVAYGDINNANNTATDTNTVTLPTTTTAPASSTTSTTVTTTTAPAATTTAATTTTTKPPAPTTAAPTSPPPTAAPLTVVVTVIKVVTWRPKKRVVKKKRVVRKK